nr:YqaA family protein [Methylomarinum sp. Ch1-1]MDP4519771.1 YqaA family protein [Methylomarinum sp. Ch1-1]
MFQKLYDKALHWSRHRHASKYLAALSFAESSFFPIPPDVMLAPMSLSQPKKAWRLALLTTVASVLGGMLGYAIGYFMFDSIAPWLQQSRYWEKYQLAEAWFQQWGVWAVFVAGFSPIPYKVFTIAAGALQMLFPPFVLASMVGRGAFFSGRVIDRSRRREIGIGVAPLHGPVGLGRRGDRRHRRLDL